MLPKGHRDRARDMLNSLSFQQQQVDFTLGHSIQSLDRDAVREPVPEHLQALAEQLDRKAFLENTAQPEAGVSEK